jgi:hypothetical protein
MNLLDMYMDDVDGRVTSVSGGKEHRGPCPKCGGTDRFGVWPNQGKHGTFYCGRGQHHGGNGCGIGGDAVQYLRDCRGYSFKEACNTLGIDTNTGGQSHKYRAPELPKNTLRRSPVPKELTWPEDVVNPELWVEHGLKFVESCHEALLARPMSIAYLAARGITMKSIVKFKLGFHLGSERGSQQYLPSFRPWPSWGLKDDRKPDGKPRMLMLPAGMVIPVFVDGTLREIGIRLIKPDPKQPKKKYHYVRGSSRPVWLTNPSAKAFVLQEAVLDCIAVDEAAGDLVGTIGLGTTGVAADTRVAAALKASYSLLDAMDFDEPKLNQRTGRMERAGSKAGRQWKEQYSQYRRWPVPEGKDAGDAFQAGIDLRAWILAGLPPIFQEPAVSPQPAVPKVSAPVQQPQEHQTVSTGKVTNDKADLHELRNLLSEANGYIRIYGQGMGLGPALSSSWSQSFPEKRARISELLFNSEAIGDVVANLADGVYSAANLSA